MNNKMKILKKSLLGMTLVSFVGCATYDRYEAAYLNDDAVFIPKVKNEIKRFPSNELTSSCTQVVHNFFKHLGEVGGKEIKVAKGFLRFPYGVEAKEGKHIQYGFESFFKFPSILCTGNQGSHVQSVNGLVL